MINSRDIVCIQENNFYSNFLLEHNHYKVENQFAMSHNDVIQIDNTNVHNNSDPDDTLNDVFRPLYILPLKHERLMIDQSKNYYLKAFPHLCCHNQMK